MNTVTKFAVALLLIVACSHIAIAEFSKISPEQISKAHKHAERGNVNLQFALGTMYKHGLGVPQDVQESVKWFRKASEQGHAAAQYNLGLAYLHGKGVKKDKRKATKWHRKAAEQGNAKAQTMLGARYSVGDDGVTKDLRKSVKWFHKAAEQGVALAQNSLGTAYWNGEGVKENKREAVKWFRKAAEQGHAIAQFFLGVAYQFGKGVIEDKYEAYIWHSIAKANGDESAAEILRETNWKKHLPHAKLKSARREAAARLKDIEARQVGAESASDPSTQLAVIQQPDTALRVFDSVWRSFVYIRSGDGQGSGVIIGKNLVATNCHVVDGKRIKVFPPQSRQATADTGISARIKTRDTVRDFCVLRVPGVGGVAATARRFATLKIGETVYALGAPKGLELTLSRGLISQLRERNGVSRIQTDTAISPGSSGGGLFDSTGNLVGIMTSKISDESVEGISFAIPADLILE